MNQKILSRELSNKNFQNAMRFILGSSPLDSNQLLDKYSLRNAIENDDLEFAEYLLSQSKVSIQDALEFSILKNHFKFVKMLIKNGADPNQAMGSVGLPLVYAAKNDNILFLKFLLENGANPQEKAGKTALYWAVDHENIKAVELLLGKGGYDKDSLCHSIKKDNLDIFKVLYEEDPNPDIKCEYPSFGVYHSVIANDASQILSHL